MYICICNAVTDRQIRLRRLRASASRRVMTVCEIFNGDLALERTSQKTLKADTLDDTEEHIDFIETQLELIGRKPR